MSQPLSPTPNPADAAAALASTKVAQPDLTNRREIPVSSFDFLAGAYEATKRARRITTAVMVIVVLGGFLNVFGAVRTNFETRDVRSQVRSVEVEREDFIAGFGTDATGISTEDILSRDRLVGGGIALAASQQGDFITLLTNLVETGGANARITRFSYGINAVDEDAPKPSETTSDKKEPAKPTTVGVSIVISGQGLEDVIDMVAAIQQLPGLTDVRVDREGAAATITGSIALNRPPREVLDRLIALGISIQAANSASPAAESETADVAEEEQGS